MADKFALETELRVGPAASKQWIAAPPKDVVVHDAQRDTHAR